MKHTIPIPIMKSQLIFNRRLKRMKKIVRTRVITFFSALKKYITAKN